MKTLTEYARNGFKFTLVCRDGNVAIFEEFGSRDHYEVIIIQSHQGREIAGKHFPPSEYPPSNEQWGTKGWTYKTLGAASAKFHQLVESQTK